MLVSMMMAILAACFACCGSCHAAKTAMRWFPQLYGCNMSEAAGIDGGSVIAPPVCCSATSKALRQGML